MRALWACALVCLALSGCSTTAEQGATPAAAPSKPEVIGKVPSQPGNCFFKDANGKVFTDACPR